MKKLLVFFLLLLLCSPAMALDLGTSVSTENPLINQDATSGLYSAGSGKVDIGISGSKIQECVSSGCTVTGSLISTNGFFDQSYSYQVPTTGSTVTMADTSDFAIIDPAVTLTALTIQLPTCSATYNGKISGYTSSQIITTLTVTATSGSVVGAPNTLAIGVGNKYICRSTNTTWYRTQ